MAGTDPYHLTDFAAVCAAAQELTEEGWNVFPSNYIDLSTGEFKAHLEANKNSDKETAFVADEGQVIKPMPGRNKFMVFDAEDYAELWPDS